MIGKKHLNTVSNISTRTALVSALLTGSVFAMSSGVDSTADDSKTKPSDTQSTTVGKGTPAGKGLKKGESPQATAKLPSDFSGAAYVAKHKDLSAVVKKGNLDPETFGRKHYLNNGIKEGRKYK